MKSRIDLGIDSFLLNYYKIEFQYIESYFAKLFEAVKSEKDNLQSLANSLKARGASEDYIADTLDEDSFNVNFFEINTYNFAILFLYYECEKLLKQDYGILTSKATKNLFKFDETKRLYKEEGISISSFSNYPRFNELRVLNNCIKHNCYPNDELCNIDSSRWLKDKKIELTYSEIQVFCKCARNFFDELVPLIETINNGRIVKDDIDLLVNVCQGIPNIKTQSEINAVLMKLQKL